MATERVCEWCGGPLDRQRRDARFCKAICRSRAWDDAHPRITVTTASVASAKPRPLSKDGYGTRVYLTKHELLALAQVAFNTESPSPSLIEKFRHALERIEAKRVAA